LGVVIFLTLPSLLFYGILHLKYNEDVPYGIQGEKTDALATKMLIALNYEAYVSTNTFEWTYKQKRHYKWEKAKAVCEVYWKQYKVSLNLKDSNQHSAYVHSFKVDGDLAKDLIKKAIKYHKNDTFWVFAPYMVFNPGVKRELVDNKDLLVTYTNGDAYLWQLEENGMPNSFKMWNSELPIDGLEMSWNNWKTTKTGAKLPTFHKVLFFGMEISHIKGTN